MHFLALGLSPQLHAASSLVSALFPGGAGKSFAAEPGGDDYAARLMLGRKAQLGEALLYTADVDGSLTYGEFALDFFAELVDRAGVPRGGTLIDVGSGCGRLVFASALLWPQLERVVGIERVASLHELAVAAAASPVASGALSPSPRVEFACEDGLAPGSPLRDADVVFAYSSSFASDGLHLTDLSVACGRQLRPGAMIVTTDKRLVGAREDPALPWEFALVDSLEGPNAEAGGTSVGYVYEVVRSERTATRN